MTPTTLTTTDPSPAQEPTHAPVAARKPHVVTSPNGDREDPYYWLRDDTRENPEMLAYLNAENAWFEQYAKRYRGLEQKLFDEIKGRIKQDDATVPAQNGGWWYYTRHVEGQEYPVHARRAGAVYSEAAAEVVLLDVNALAAGHDFFQIGGMDVSPSQKMLAYAQDTVGRRQYEIHFRNLETGETYADTVPQVSGDLAWAADDKTLFYVENEPTTLRSYRVKKHVLGTDAKDDVLMYEEKDEAYYTDIHRTTSDRYLVITVSSTESDEQRVLRADRPDGAFEIIAPRRDTFHYHADHIATGAEGDRWIVRTDWQAPNYRLMQVATDKLGDRAAWQPLVPHSEQVFINDFDLFANYYVIDERSAGLRRLRVVPWAGGESFYLDATEPAYTMSLGNNLEQATDTLRYGYSSLTTPDSVYQVDMKTGAKTLLKTTPVLGGFDAKSYVTERVWVEAGDGVEVPVSLVYRKGFEKDGSAPLLQYGYGSYGLSMDPTFRSSVLSLLDRGFVYAIAHIRGGEEMGRAWYETGKKLKKMNTFTDFIAVTEALVKERYAAKDKVFMMGGSAGGLLMGAVRQPAARSLSGRHRTGAVRRRRHDDARREHPADHQRVRRVGQPEAEELLQVHALVLALRQRQEAGLSGDVRRDRSARFAGPVLRAREVGCEAADPEYRQGAAAVQDQPGGRPRRQVGSLQETAGNRRGICVHARPRRDSRVVGRSGRTPDPSPDSPGMTMSHEVIRGGPASCT